MLEMIIKVRANKATQNCDKNKNKQILITRD